MKIRDFVALLVFAGTFIAVQASAQNKVLADGVWRGVFKVNGIEVPFNFEVKEGKGSAPVLTAINGERRDDFNVRYTTPDSIKIMLNTFETAWFAKIEQNGSISGVQKSLVTGRELPFAAVHGQSYRFFQPEKVVAAKLDLSGKWTLRIKESSSDGKKAAPDRVAVFEQKGNKLNGIILSVTGDSRELQGDVQGEEFFLSGFTGASPSYVRGKIIDEKTITGSIGASAEPVVFEGFKNDKAALVDPYSLTFLKPGYGRLAFTFPDINGKQVSLSDEKYKGKVVIIEIMGTWCPNCIDQIQFLAPWYKENKVKGVEAIALAFEAKDDLNFAKGTLTKLKNRYDIQYDMLFAGKVGGNVVAEKLPAIDKFLAYPTTIIVGRDGKVKEIHTGFSGKGTGQYYQEYVKKWNEDLAKLIAEPLP